MIIIETCPECGHDLQDLVLTCNPPKHGKICMNCGWTYHGDSDDNDVVRIPFSPPTRSVPTEVTYTGKEPYDPCAHCSNDPRNGGSGICCCTVPYMTSRRNTPWYYGPCDINITTGATGKTASSYTITVGDPVVGTDIATSSTVNQDDKCVTTAFNAATNVSISC